MKYKGLLLDVDRTLIRDDQTISSQVISAIRSVKSKVRVGLCSGRPYFAYKHYLEQLELDGLHISHGGAQIVEFPSGKVQFEEVMPERISRQIYKEMSRVGCVVILQDSRYQYQDLRKILDPKFPVEYRPIRALKDWRVPKIVIYGLDQEKWKLLNEFTQVHVSQFVYRDFPLEWADITPKHINKQAAVLKWAKFTGMEPAEIVAVGDGPNDYPMLMAAGLKIAMGNAVQELKDIADFVCPSVDEDGVATVIEKFFS